MAVLIFHVCIGQFNFFAPNNKGICFNQIQPAF